jgi:hypothetical protein
MVGSAVGIRTVSSATRKIDIHSAVYASKVERAGRELAISVLATWCSLIDDAEDFSAPSGRTDALTTLVAESRVREVCLDDLSDGMPELPACSGPNFEVRVLEAP